MSYNIEKDFNEILNNNNNNRDIIIEDPTSVSLNDWILYLKYNKNNKNTNRYQYIKFQIVNGTEQMLSYYDNELESFTADLTGKLLKLWLKSALIDNEERESLIYVYNNGYKTIQQDKNAIILLERIIEFINI